MAEIKGLLKSFKTEINPTEEQKAKIRKTVGTCRYIYNFYLTHNKELYDKGEKFMSGKSFSVWLNNEYLPQNPDKLWNIDSVSFATTILWIILYKIHFYIRSAFLFKIWKSTLMFEKSGKCDTAIFN